MIKKLFFILVFFLPLLLHAQNNRITYNNQSLFLSGANVGWINFAHDIGNGNTDTAGFRKIFRQVHDYGGNCMRLWLHTNGTVTPAFNGSKVSGPGPGAITDLRRICDLAYHNDIGLILCLWSFDMLRKTNGTMVNDRNKGILTVDTLMNSYINNALIPMVDSLKGHPGIIAWEIFNEPEGMTSVGNWSEIDQVTILDVQKFVNRCAGAIHRTDPGTKVTNGAWSSVSATDIGGGSNYYTDARLMAAGGDADGKLDFYCFHYYDNIGLSPFEHPCSYWQLDKPLVIAEFYPFCSHCGTGSSYENLIKNGYAGAMGWSWRESHMKDIRDDMQYLFDNYSPDVDINRFLKNAPSVNVVSPLPDARFGTTDVIRFAVQAKSIGSEVNEIDIMEGSNLIFKDTDAPYEYDWSNVPENFYKISVTVKDADGYVKISDPISITVGNPPKKLFEAEEAVLSGTATVVNTVTANKGKMVHIDQTGYIEWTLPKAPSNNNYNINIIYRATYGDKNQYIIVNNDESSRLDVAFQGASDVWSTKTLTVPFTTSVNKLKLEASWGWMDFDYIELPFGVVVSTEVRADNEIIYKLYPTILKASDDIIIECLLSKPQRVTITITDVNGRVVQSENRLFVSGLNTVRIGTTSFRPGIYVVSTTTPSGMKTSKIIIN